MRHVLFGLALTALAGCYGTGEPGSAAAPTATPATAEAPAMAEARVARWEGQWAAARQDVVIARQEAVSTGRPIAPEVEAEVTELLNRDLESADDEERIQRLQDAVEDALRLAELVRIG